MPLTRTWNVQAIDQVPADQTTALLVNKSTLFALKRFLTGADPVVGGDTGLWTVDRSSNGTTAGAGDNWASQTDVKWHTDGSAHSWIVFKSPSGFVGGGNFVYLEIDCIGSGSDTATEFIRMYMSGAAFTGGSTTARATSVGESRLNSGNDFVFLRNTGAGAPFGGKWHGVRNTVGDCAFFFSRTGTGYAQTAFIIAGLADAEAGHNFPCLAYARFQDSAKGALVATTVNANSIMGLWIDGTTLGDNSFATLAPIIAFSGNAYLLSVDPNGSDITGLFYDWVIEAVNTSGAKIARFGKMVDISFAPAGGVVQLTGQPASGTLLKAIVGELWIPFTPTKPTSFS